MLKLVDIADQGFGPIIEVHDGTTLIVKVLQIRPTTGEYDGHLIDIEAPDGTAASINGHKQLLDKIQVQYVGSPTWFRITRNGMRGRMIRYDVQFIDMDEEDILNDRKAKPELDATTNYIADEVEKAPLNL